MENRASANPENTAQVLVPTSDVTEEMSFFMDLGFRLDNIFPDDDPEVAVMSGHGIHIRLDKNATAHAPTLHLLTDHPEAIGNGQHDLTAPGGTKLILLPKSYTVKRPATVHKFEVRKLEDSDPWVIGRAGMLYRDLIPDRLGGGIIASHIRIPNGGPVPDSVHYHTIGFQLIFCYNGWVKLVYEDQGAPFILEAGDCVTQPPEIRHRVLEASDNLEVIEIGVPAEHMTTIDHDMDLPTEDFRPDRAFQGQKFCHHVLKDANWKAWRINGMEFRDTGIDEATAGLASVHIGRAKDHNAEQRELSHDADILFTFIMQGKMELAADGHTAHRMRKGDAFVIPPNLKHTFSNLSDDLELLEVSLPGKFKTMRN